MAPSLDASLQAIGVLRDPRLVVQGQANCWRAWKVAESAHAAAVAEGDECRR